jgi:2-hydroxychromene-2-carboxylate isomerase
MSERTPDAVEFYFEFSSPYAYFASERVEAICARWGLPLVWRPILLGAILERTGQRPLLTDGVRGAYAVQDCLRWARLNGIPFRVPQPHPVNSLKAARGALALEGDPRHAAYIHACMRAYWAAGQDISEDGVLAGVVAGLGLDVPAFHSRIAAPAIKERLRAETGGAWARGVFGTPTCVYRDERFWGNDRLPVLERVIEEAGARAV